MQLPFKRFVKQVSSGGSFSKYGYIDMMQRNAAALESAKWHEAQCSPSDVSLTVGQLTRTDGAFDETTGIWNPPPSYTAWFDDRYDVFAQGGDANARMATFCGYAGCVAYRFSLPTADQSALNTLKVAIQRDRYLRAGVRISVMLSNDESPDTFGWNSIRHGMRYTPSETPVDGTVGVTSWGFLAQPSASCVLASRAAEGVWAIGDEEHPVFVQALMETMAYLWVFITLEDPAAYWDHYNSKELRQYYIEGSAKLVSVDFTFASDSTVAPSETWFAAGLGVATVRGAILDGDDYAEAGAILGEAAWAGNVSSVYFPGRMEALPYMLDRLTGTLLHPFRPARFNNIVYGPVSGFNFGSPASFVHAPDMMKLAGMPTTNAGQGLFFVMRNTINSATPISGGHTQTAQWVNLGDYDSAAVGEQVVSLNATLQAFWGFCAYVVPGNKPAYTRLRMRNTVNVTAHQCSCAINIWRSRSPDAVGPFANVALAGLAANPAFFTAAKASISASPSVELRRRWEWREEVITNVDPETETSAEFQTNTTSDLVNLSAKADLLATVPADDFVGSLPQSGYREIEVGNIAVAPGDLLILAPNFNSIFPETTDNAIWWGVRSNVSAETVNIYSGVGFEPTVSVM